MVESVLIDTFITGLETNLQAEVKSRHPVTLEDCMREAQMVSDHDLAIKLALNDWRGRGPAVAEAQAQSGKQVTLKVEKKEGKCNDFAMKQILIPIEGNYAKGEPSVKCLSDSEFRARLDKGLCFQCNDKYSPGHRCKGVEFKTLKVKGETEILLRTILGFTSKGTIKLRGTVRGREVIILIDNGATHNFIHQGVVEESVLPLEGKTKLIVTIGDGTALEGKGICKRLEVKLPELTIVADFLVIELGSDLVLSMQWLSTTGFMGIHWSSMTMVFMARMTQVVLEGDPSLTKAECSLTTISETWEEEDQGFLLEFQNVEMNIDTEEESEKEEEGEESKLRMINNLLKRYRSIFEMPKRLPQKRVVDHRILIVDGQKPINVHPYKYGYIQKEEIEKLVSEMIQAGIIRSSRRPYSSPVLLVKKRDGGWRFCVDYCKLNQVTIVDTFPIPVIEELLDELHGAKIRQGLWKYCSSTEAFESLKQAMISVLVLALPDFSLPFTVETDASVIGLGAVLSQNSRPIAYFSQKLSPRAQAKSIYERELMAVDIEMVTAEVERDEERQEIINILKENPEGKANYWWVSGGHSGFLRTYKLMNGEIHWVGMKNDKKYVEQCEICQRNKTEALSPASLLQPLPLPNLILEDWTMDFIEGLPKAGGYNSIMVLVDRLSKMAHFITLKHPFTAKQVAEKFVEEIVSIGDNVYLKLRPYRQRSLARKRCEKLAPKFYGSYRIIEEIGSGVRWNSELGANKWLVKWKGLHDSEFRLESVYAMNQQYPSFHLEDKVSFEYAGEES
ncbi:Retrotransposable element Tf2 [Cucumis melo var. makuwa]|uniref:Retrotransposable element Tf2 n=1 Tax=Cucumis melo var. makuwa TaxID=1194695 RepID=A0A5D3DSW7_CUCMM|nr:Retrotransposable element Tf2 [Cucumis melo var. makuwa]